MVRVSVGVGNKVGDSVWVGSEVGVGEVQALPENMVSIRIRIRPTRFSSVTILNGIFGRMRALRET
jgi:hypothetical protein